MSEAVFGKYRLLAELGHGGMADVFLAVVAGPAGSGFSKLTVIKRLRANLAEDPEFVSMLVDEARIAARLNHPNVVQTNEVGQVGAQYFLAMEYLDGQPLHRIQHRAAQALAKEGKVVFPEDLQYVTIMDSLAGLHHAHELADYDGTPLEIVHRDVTPHNVFVTYEGQAKVVDFGIAKATGRASETRQGVVKGKVRYMAPEQAMGLAVDRRADIFSAGVMLWEVATGRRMWKDMDDLKIVHSLIGGEIPSSPRAVKAEVPEAIDAICKKALAARPQDRYATADEFRTDLEQFMAESGRLVEARRKLGPAVTQLFADKRAELKAVIEAQLSQLKARPSTAEIVALPSEQAPLSMTSGPVSVSGPMTVPVDEATSATTAEPPTAIYRSGGGGKAKLAGIAAIGLAVTLLGAWAVARTQAGRPNEPTAKNETSSAKVEEIVVGLDAQPSTAKIKLDDRDLGNSFHGRVPRDGKMHRVVIEADGYITRQETLSFSADLEREFRLEPVHKEDPTAKLTGTAAATNATPRWWPPPKASANAHASATTPASSAPAPVTDPTPAPSTPSSAPATTGPRRKRDIDKNDPWATGKEGQTP